MAQARAGKRPMAPRLSARRKPLDRTNARKSLCFARQMMRNTQRQQELAAFVRNPELNRTNPNESRTKHRPSPAATASDPPSGRMKSTRWCPSCPNRSPKFLCNPHNTNKRKANRTKILRQIRGRQQPRQQARMTKAKCRRKSKARKAKLCLVSVELEAEPVRQPVRRHSL